MIARTKFFFFVIVLQCPPSLLLPLEHQVVATNNNKSLVLETNQTELITPKNSKVTELIQQIDVKDNANKVISNINHVTINDDMIVTIPSTRNENNGSNNLVANNATVVITKEDSNKTGVTNALNAVNVKNITVLELQNEVTNGTKSNASSKNVVSFLNTNLSSNLKKSINSESIAIGDNDNNSTPVIDNRSFRESLPLDNTTFTNSVKEISSAEAPAFRSLIPDKIRKRQVSKAVSTTVAPTTTKDHNLVLKLIPDSSPITINLNQIPLNNLFGEAFSFIKRFKRNTPDTDKTPKKSNCKSIPIDESHNVKVCNKTITDNGLNTSLLTPTRKSLEERFFDVQELYDTVLLVCPLSVIVKLYTHQVLNKLTKDNLHYILNQVLSSFMKGDENAITVISTELSELPLKIKLRLQLLHGETKEFLEELSNTVDKTLCSIS